MASSLYWPGKYPFYPIGNTSAVCLTRDVPHDAPANILLLACGDPRNVLYTVFCEAPTCDRHLDFTCCDFDPGVLARNVLLCTMIIDGVPDQTTWNVFYHMYLDADSRLALVSQCQKLAAYSSIEAWRSSPYGATIRIGTDHTFTELRRHWRLYADLYQPTNSHRLQALREVMEDRRKAILHDHNRGVNLSSPRSAGPLLSRTQVITIFNEQVRRYWKTGTTFTDASEVATSTHPNSTFFYSRAHEGFDVHYATDPMMPFHHAPLFGNADSVTVQDLVESAKSQFSAWCSAFKTAVATSRRAGGLVVRFILGDALSVSRALQVWPSERTVFKVAQWTACTVALEREEYEDFGAPVRFNVINTSNLSDDVGLHNIFLCAVPLLANFQSSVLYTESLVTHTAEPTTELHAKLFADLPVVALLLYLAPVDALSGFTTMCNTHELVIAKAFTPDSSTPQHHQVLTWRRPSTGDSSASSPHGDGTYRPVSVNTLPFATLLHKIFLHLFTHEDPDHLKGIALRDVPRALSWASSWCPSRESFIMLLGLFRARLQIPDTQWSDIMRAFLELQHVDALRGRIFDLLGHNEMHAQLYRYGLHTITGLDQVRRPTAGRLSYWPSIPPLIRVFLTVPRACFAKLEIVSERMPTPWLHCSIKYPNLEHAFQSVEAVYGTVVDKGTKAAPDISIVEDPEGYKNNTPLVCSFVVPGRLLAETGPNPVYVRIAARSNPAASDILTPILGPALAIFTTSLQDRSCVHLAPEQPLSPQPFSALVPPLRLKSEKVSRGAIGTQKPVHVDLDATTGKRIASLTARLEIEDAHAKTSFSGGDKPHVSQISPCAIQVVVGGLAQTITYPLPVVCSRRQVRVARKSSYIEVVVTVAIPFSQPDGFKLNPFPIVRANNSTFPWNLHRVPLDLLPVLNVATANLAGIGKWYNPHVGSQLSVRERALTAAKRRDVDVLTNVKDTIHFLMVRGAGTQGATPAKVIALRDDVTDDCDTIFFVDKVRFDVGAHAMVLDAFILPLCPALMPTINPVFEQLLRRGVVNVRVYSAEMHAWKQLLPALVERCRTAWTHRANCEYVAAGKVPLELETSEGDPLCSCGRGKNVEGMLCDDLWKKFAPFVTRVAISPLFAVSYLEPVFGRDGESEATKPGLASDFVSALRSVVVGRSTDSDVGGMPAVECQKCRRRGSGALQLLRCSRCKRAVYCSGVCQKADWKDHKLHCRK